MSRHPADDLDDDLRDHVAREIQEQIAGGLPPAEARAAALRALGSRAAIRDEVRGVWVSVWLDQVRRDALYAWRPLRRSKGFTTVAVLTLALGIASTTAIFSVVYGLFFAPLPYRQADRLSWSGSRIVANGEMSARRRSSPGSCRRRSSRTSMPGAAVRSTSPPMTGPGA